eukprot:9939594-Alexandrium_andersonii.AAC.1
MYAKYYFQQRDFQYGDPDDGAYVRHVCPYCIALDYDLIKPNGYPDWYQGWEMIKRLEGRWDRERSL